MIGSMSCFFITLLIGETHSAQENVVAEATAPRRENVPWCENVSRHIFLTVKVLNSYILFCYVPQHSIRIRTPSVICASLRLA